MRARLLLPVLLVLASGCSPATRNAGRPTPQRDVITREEIERAHHQTVFELVQALRANWMRTRGTDSIVGRPSEVQVYVDGIRVGQLEYLRTINPMIVESVQYYDGIQASSRWGLDHGAGVIYVSTRH